MGNGSFEILPQESCLFGRNILFVTGSSSMKKLGFLDKAITSLEKYGANVVLLDGITPEPTTEMVNRGAELAKEKNIEVVIGLGGGSVIDCAKAIAGVANKENLVEEYLKGKQLESPGLPFIAVPTTAGTGAEVTPNAVLIQKNLQKKESFRSPLLFAKVAIIDPRLTVQLPPKITAESGMDALCQAIETYVSVGANPVTDALVIDAIEMIGDSICKVYQDGENLDLREKMLYGSLLTGMALCNARMGAVHGIAHPLGAIYNLSHGLVCGMLLPYVMELNLDVAVEKYAHVASLLGETIKGMPIKEAAKKAIEKIRSILKILNFPERLRELGVKQEDFPRIIEDSMPSGSLKANPKKVSPEDVEWILKSAW
jgi:alcohol dehydrogenase class IV